MNEPVFPSIPTHSFTDKIVGPIELYTDGSNCDPQPSPIGGAWAYVIVGRNEQGGLVVIGEGHSAFLPHESGTGYVTNNNTELFAIIQGIRAYSDLRWKNPDAYPDAIKICSDSNVALSWWQGVARGKHYEAIPDLLMGRLQSAQRFAGTACLTVTVELLSGHPVRRRGHELHELELGYSVKTGRRVSVFNVWCDRRCTEHIKKLEGRVI